MCHSEAGFTTNVPLEEFIADDCLLAYQWDGKEIEADHGWPLRGLVPRLYLWKSAKWIRGIELREPMPRGSGSKMDITCTAIHGRRSGLAGKAGRLAGGRIECMLLRHAGVGCLRNMRMRGGDSCVATVSTGGMRIARRRVDPRSDAGQDMATQISLLEGIPLFAALSGDEKGDLVRRLSVRDVAEGETLFWMGDEGDDFYVISSGRLAIVYPDGDGKEVTLAVLGTGDFLGEVSLLDGGRRTATARAQSAASLLCLGRDAFAEFLRESPSAALHVIKVLGPAAARKPRQAARHPQRQRGDGSATHPLAKGRAHGRGDGCKPSFSDRACDGVWILDLAQPFAAIASRPIHFHFRFCACGRRARRSFFRCSS